MPGFGRWPAIMSSSPRSAVLLRVGASHGAPLVQEQWRAVGLRRTFRIPATGFGSCYPEGICVQITQGNAELSRPCCAERLAGTALPGTVARDPARHIAPFSVNVPFTCQATGSVADVRAGERAALMLLPPAFDGFVEHEPGASRPPVARQAMHASPRGGLINFERNRYSVPASFANRPVGLRVYPDRLVVVMEARLWRDAAEGNILCEHVRVIQRSHKLPPQTNYEWRHQSVLRSFEFTLHPERACKGNRCLGVQVECPNLIERNTLCLAVIQRKPPLTGCKQTVAGQRVVIVSLSAMPASPVGQWMVDILALVLHHDEQAVLTAVEMALAAGVPTKTHVLNMVGTGWSSKAPQPLKRLCLSCPNC